MYLCKYTHTHFPLTLFLTLSVSLGLPPGDRFLERPHLPSRVQSWEKVLGAQCSENLSPCPLNPGPPPQQSPLEWMPQAEACTCPPEEGASEGALRSRAPANRQKQRGA